MLTYRQMWLRINGTKPYPQDSGRDAWIPNRLECYQMASTCFDLSTRLGVLEWLKFKTECRLLELRQGIQHRLYSPSETAEYQYLQKLQNAIDFAQPHESLSRLHTLYAARLAVLCSRPLDENERNDFADVRTILSVIAQANSGTEAELPPEVVTRPAPAPEPSPEPVPEPPKSKDVLAACRNWCLQRVSALQQKGTRLPGKTPAEEAEQSDLAERIRLLNSPTNTDSTQRELMASFLTQFRERERILQSNPISTVETQSELAEIYRMQSLLQQNQDSTV